MTDLSHHDLAQLIHNHAKGHDRYIVAVAGPPASGKSTLADSLAAQLGAHASVLPMDGFHLDNDVLSDRGLLHRKGAAETFDAIGFVDLLRRVRTTKELRYPTFDRQLDRAIPDSGKISADTRIVLVEGNYLLLNTAPWSELEEIFDLTISITVAAQELEARLIQRWLDHGLPLDQARARARGNDMKNAEYVIRNARDADISFQNGI